MTEDKMRRMAGGALAVSAFSIAVALLAYWRAGAKPDVEGTHAEFRAAIDSLQARQTDMVEHTRASLAAAYAANHDRLRRLRELMRIEKKRADADLRMQLDRAETDANELVREVEAGARTARESTLAAAEQAEQALTQRVRMIEGRLALLRAKHDSRRAQLLLEKREPDEALRALVAAADRVDDALERLPSEHDQALTSLRVDLHEAIASVQAGALDSRARLDDVLHKTDSLVRTLEDAEDAAAGRAQAGRRAS